MGVDTPSWGFLLFAIGLVATLLIVEGCRLLFGVREQANRQFALQRRMIDHAAEAMILTDAAQRILTVNTAFEQTTGYRASEVLGLTGIGARMARSIRSKCALRQFTMMPG